jgi:hypothetical protein
MVPGRCQGHSAVGTPLEAAVHGGQVERVLSPASTRIGPIAPNPAFTGSQVSPASRLLQKPSSTTQAYKVCGSWCPSPSHARWCRALVRERSGAAIVRQGGRPSVDYNWLWFWKTYHFGVIELSNGPFLGRRQDACPAPTPLDFPLWEVIHRRISLEMCQLALSKPAGEQDPEAA